ncbi:MAG: hypothetical protein U1E56_08975 [Bauldia sp.]
MGKIRLLVPMCASIALGVGLVTPLHAQQPATGLTIHRAEDVDAEFRRPVGSTPVHPRHSVQLDALVERVDNSHPTEIPLLCTVLRAYPVTFAALGDALCWTELIAGPERGQPN